MSIDDLNKVDYIL